MEKRMMYILVGIVVLVFVALAINLSLGSGNNLNLTAYDNKPVSPSLLAAMQVPNNVSNIVGLGGSINDLQPVTGSPLIINGKPVILYIGAEYCPFCAAQRWAMVVALMRFGTFTGLKYMTSSAADLAPSSPTFTFYGSNYSSSYITFVPVETTTNQPEGAYYAPLQTPNAWENSTYLKYNAKGSIPFIDFANKSIITGTVIDPISVINNKNWTTIVAQLYNSSSPQAQQILGSANLFTAEICKITNNTPTSVCSQSYVTQIQGKLGNSG